MLEDTKMMYIFYYIYNMYYIYNNFSVSLFFIAKTRLIIKKLNIKKLNRFPVFVGEITTCFAKKKNANVC